MRRNTLRCDRTGTRIGLVDVAGRPNTRKSDSGKLAQRWLLPGGSAWYPRLFELYFNRVRPGIQTRAAEQRAILAALGPVLKPGQRVLELGSGTGHYTSLLRQSGAQVWARDASPAMINYLARRLRRAGFADVNVDLGLFPDDLRINGTFDGVLSVGMINYIADLARTFGRIAECLSPGGWVVFNVPRADSTGRRYANVELLGRRRVYLRSTEQVDQAVTNAGLRLTDGPIAAGVTAVYRCEAMSIPRPDRVGPPAQLAALIDAESPAASADGRL